MWSKPCPPAVPAHVLFLLSVQLIELLQKSPARGLELSMWIRAVFTAHTAYLMTVSASSSLCMCGKPERVENA